MTYVLVDDRVLEDDESSGGAHRPVKEGVDRHTDETDLVASVCPVRSRGEHVVEQLQQVPQVPNRVLLAGRILQVRLRVGHLDSQPGMTWHHRASEAYLLEHEGEQHSEPWVILDRLLELLEDGLELLGVLVDMLNSRVQELVLVPPVLRQPVAGLLRQHQARL